MTEQTEILEAIENLRSDMREDNEALHHRMDAFMGNCATRHNGVDLKELKRDVTWLRDKYWLFIGGASVIWAISLIAIGFLK